MKALSVLFLPLSVFVVAHLTPGEISYKHHSYVTYYNRAIKEADSVAWDLTPEMVQCDTKQFPRKDAFKADPNILGCVPKSDYDNSGYDKGHLFSYDDAICNAVDRVECFYMSNMLPQLHPFNAGDWKSLEVQERVFAKTMKLHIVAGGYGQRKQQHTLKTGEVVPAVMWKAILMNGKYTVYIMPNQNTSIGHKYDYWATPLHSFDTKTIAAYVSANALKYGL